MEEGGAGEHQARNPQRRGLILRARFAFAAIVLIVAVAIAFAVSTSDSAPTTNRSVSSPGATVEAPTQTVGGDGPAQFHPLP